MISSELLGILLNKYALGSIAVLISLVYAYLKGKSAAKELDRLQQLEAEKAQAARLRAAEAKNAYLEKKGEQINGKITSADTIDSLIGLFNEINTPKSSSDLSDKNGK